MQDLGIRWEVVSKVAKDARQVVTGDAAEETEEASDESVLRWTDKPLIVYVCDEAEGCEDFDKLEEVVLKDEKVALGMKAFRTVKMHPDDAAEDALLEGLGKDVPRMVLIEPVKMKTKVLEPKKLKTSTLFKAMKSIAGKFYKENLDKVVKKHLKLLTEQDKLANEEKVLNEQKSRLEEDEKAKAKKIEKRLAELAKEKAELLSNKAENWKLTPKKKAA